MFKTWPPCTELLKWSRRSISSGMLLLTIRRNILRKDGNGDSISNSMWIMPSLRSVWLQISLIPFAIEQGLNYNLNRDDEPCQGFISTRGLGIRKKYLRKRLWGYPWLREDFFRREGWEATGPLLRLSLATYFKFHFLKKYSISFIAHSKKIMFSISSLSLATFFKFGPLYQQYTLFLLVACEKKSPVSYRILIMNSLKNYTM